MRERKRRLIGVRFVNTGRARTTFPLACFNKCLQMNHQIKNWDETMLKNKRVFSLLCWRWFFFFAFFEIRQLEWMKCTRTHTPYLFYYDLQTLVIDLLANRTVRFVVIGIYLLGNDTIRLCIGFIYCGLNERMYFL